MGGTRRVPGWCRDGRPGGAGTGARAVPGWVLGEQRRTEKRHFREGGVRDGWLRAQGRARWRRGLARIGCSRLGAIRFFRRRHICRHRDGWRREAHHPPDRVLKSLPAQGIRVEERAACTGRVPKGCDRVIRTRASAAGYGHPPNPEDQPARSRKSVGAEMEPSPASPGTVKGTGAGAAARSTCSELSATVSVYAPAGSRGK